MPRSFVVLSILLGISAPALALTDEPQPARPTSSPLPLNVAYFGETFAHPGLLVGSEHSVLESGWHRAFLAADLGGYRHPGNHVGLFVQGALGYRLAFPSGLSLESLAGIGYLHTLLDGDVYAPSPTGGVEGTRDLGRPAFMPSLALGLGLDGAGLGLKATRLFTRLQLFGQTPYNSYVLPHVATQVGLTWNYR